MSDDWNGTDMADPVNPTPEEQQRERYLPKWTQDLLKELRREIGYLDERLTDAHKCRDCAVGAHDETQEILRGLAVIRICVCCNQEVES